MKYHQGRDDYCMTFSLASALHYAGEWRAAMEIANCAEELVNSPRMLALKKLYATMDSVLPKIAKYTVLNDFLDTRQTRKRRRGPPRRMTVKELVMDLTPYPTFVIPIGQDGSTNHTFCVVGDIIFDSTQRHPMSLTWKHVNWILGKGGVKKIGFAVRFCQSKRFNNKYNREMKLWLECNRNRCGQSGKKQAVG